MAVTALISTKVLGDRLGSGKLHVLDCSWHMPSAGRDAKAEFAQAHIPDAAFFDIDAVSDRSSPFPHMLPSAEEMEAAMATIGIAQDDDIVVYDTEGIFSAPRVWWMLRVFGHKNVWVLDGGLLKWKAEGRKLEAKTPATRPAPTSPWKADFNPALVRSKQQVQKNIKSKHELLLDARSPGRFEGKEPEPRAGLKSGHIEGSRNIFFKDLLSAPHQTLKSRQVLQAYLSAQGIDPSQPIAATCGSGVTACIVALALHEAGNPNVAIYDGAWAEWGAMPN